MRLIVIAFIAIFLAGCASGSTIVTGQIRPAIDPKQVKVLLEAPSGHEVVGIVDARSLGGFTDQEKQNYALEELKSQAAAIGANAIVLMTTGTEVTSGGTFVSQPYGGGTFIPSQSRQKTLSATAIYVKP
mgnify:FL=1